MDNFYGIAIFCWWKMFDEPFGLPSLVEWGIVERKCEHAHFCRLKEGAMKFSLENDTFVKYIK